MLYTTTIAPSALTAEFFKTNSIEKYKRQTHTTCQGVIEHYDLISFIKDFNIWLSNLQVKVN